MSTLFSLVIKVLLGVTVFVAAFLWFKPQPAYLLGEDAPVLVPAESVRFYRDTTFVTESGERKLDQQIWDRAFSLMKGAERYVLLDLFLFNDFQGAKPEKARALSSELTNLLLEKKKENKDLPIAFVTDPINQVYGGDTSEQISALKSSGVTLVETNLTPLRDSNLVWSAFWRAFVQWFGNTSEGGKVRHPFSAEGGDVTVRSWLALLNFKANHRKLVVADESLPGKNASSTHKMITIVTSSNPHDGSSAHGNVALEVRDKVWEQVIAGERAVAKLGGEELPSFVPAGVVDADGPLTVTLLRDGRIKKKVLEILDSAQKGDTLMLAMFYLSDRDVVGALSRAGERSVSVRIILDPNKDAFGFEKNGIPNRPVAKELVRRGGGDITVRWCDTHGEQCHAKLFMGKIKDKPFLLLGSANFTRRNLGDYNLEASLSVEAEKEFPAWTDAEKYFETMWKNEGGGYTVDYSIYQDQTSWKSSLYRFMERTGLSSF